MLVLVYYSFLNVERILLFSSENWLAAIAFIDSFDELILLGRTQVKDLTHLRFLLLTCRSAVAGLEIVDGTPR